MLDVVTTYAPAIALDETLGWRRLGTIAHPIVPDRAHAAVSATFIGCSQTAAVMIRSRRNGNLDAGATWWARATSAPAASTPESVATLRHNGS